MKWIVMAMLFVAGLFIYASAKDWDWRCGCDKRYAHVYRAPQSHCYVPGEAHNELTLPCVTIEP